MAKCQYLSVVASTQQNIHGLLVTKKTNIFHVVFHVLLFLATKCCYFFIDVLWLLSQVLTSHVQLIAFCGGSKIQSSRVASHLVNGLYPGYIPSGKLTVCY